MTKSPSQFLEQAAQHEMLIEQNERLNFILNKTPALIGYWDSQLINQFSNDAYSRWFVESPEQIKGMHLSQLLGDEIYTSLLSEIDGVLSGKEQRFERYLIDVNTGEKIHTLTRYLPDIVNDRVIGFFVLGTDVTDVKNLEQLAYYDNLTGLPSRLLLMDRINQAIIRVKRQGGFVAVLFVDLDGFKFINDHYGHDVGDEFLIAISQQMKKAIRDTDTLARLGGDEFVIILEALNHSDDVDVIIPYLLNACNSLISLRGLALKVSASIGGFLYPEDVDCYDIDAASILSRADQAMYIAKHQGKNCYHLFDRNQDQAIITRNNAIEAMQLGLSRDEFKLYYQPIVNMRTGQVLGFEALIRWNKNHTELLEPSKFLFVVENKPLGIELGNWVIKTALTQLAQWHQQGLELTLSVNVDARQLMQVNFVDCLQAELKKLPGFKPGSLVLEILESSVIDDFVKVTDIINQCNALGIAFALDDFGTGYSSIAHLRELPVKAIKIDLSFIKGITHSEQDYKLVNHLIHLVTDLRKLVIAEGVETVEHGKILLGFGCEVAQGYAIAKPMPANNVLKWVRDWQSDASWLNVPRSDRNYHLLFEQMSEPMLISKNGRYIDCNTAAVKFLGYPYKERLLSQRPNDISPVLQPDGQRSVDKVEIIKEALLLTGRQSFEWLLLRADGSEVLVESSLSVIKLEDGDIVQVIWRDLSQ